MKFALKRSVLETAATVKNASDRPELWRGVSDSWKKLTRQVESNLGKIGLGIAEFRILNTLDAEGPSPMAHLSHETLVTQAAITVIVDNLEEGGFVRRTRSEEDRRVVNVEITPKGKLKHKEALKIHKVFIERMLEGLTDEELATLSNIMGKLAP
jgi:DNA-binding MarR family transcriptional regulator